MAQLNGVSDGQNLLFITKMQLVALTNGCIMSVQMIEMYKVWIWTFQMLLYKFQLKS